MRLLSALLLVTALAACGGEDDGQAEPGSGSASSTSAAAAPEPAADVSIDAIADLLECEIGRRGDFAEGGLPQVEEVECVTSGGDDLTITDWGSLGSADVAEYLELLAESDNYSVLLEQVSVGVTGDQALLEQIQATIADEIGTPGEAFV